MDASHLSHLANALRPASRRAAVTFAAGALATLLRPMDETSLARKRKRKNKKKKCQAKPQPGNPCAGKNWCVDRSQTCGPEGGYGKCLVEATGGNICAEVLFQVPTCADCEPANCVDCLCVLATGGGDRCANGINGYEFICARAV